MAFRLDLSNLRSIDHAIEDLTETIEQLDQSHPRAIQLAAMIVDYGHSEASPSTVAWRSPLWRSRHRFERGQRLRVPGIKKISGKKCLI